MPSSQTKPFHPARRVRASSEHTLPVTPVLNAPRRFEADEDAELPRHVLPAKLPFTAGDEE